MWTVYEKKGLLTTLHKLPPEVKRKYEKWKKVIQYHGPEGLRSIKGFHDEALKGDQKEFRSSRLGKKYRVIYKRNKNEFYVLVIDVTAHDYRRK